MSEPDAFRWSCDPSRAGPLSLGILVEMWRRAAQAKPRHPFRTVSTDEYAVHSVAAFLRWCNEP
jgi:hypothetical protein